MASSLRNAPLYLAGAAAVASVCSIAVNQNLLGLATLALLIARVRWRFPPVWLPLALFLTGTLVSLVANGHIRAGFPQVKKFYVYLILFVVVSAVRTLAQVRTIALFWVLAAALSSTWGMVQLVHKYRLAQEQHRDFYRFYVAGRITGFMDHWMTFSGEMMIALMILGSLVFLAHERRWLVPLIAAGIVITAALLLAYSRIMWAGTVVGGIYLLWIWKKWAVLAVPVLAGIVLAANPLGVRERVISIFEPHGDLDSNAHRQVTRRVGWEMIKAHPLVGVGPEQVGPQFENYLPADIPRPLPEGYYKHLHNIYIHYAAERGIPTMLAIVWLLLRALTDFARGLWRRPKSARRWMLHGGIATILAVMVGGLNEYNLNDSEVLAMFLAVVACGYVALYEGDENASGPHDEHAADAHAAA
jgi:O-antigen ligase